MVIMSSVTINASKNSFHSVVTLEAADVVQIYRVVQKNEATLHFPKYLENY